MILLTFLLAVTLVPMLPADWGTAVQNVSSMQEASEGEVSGLSGEKIYCIAETDEQALEIATAYGLTFTERQGKIAYFINETDIETEKLIRIGLEKGLDPVSIARSRNLPPVVKHQTHENPVVERKHS